MKTEVMKPKAAKCKAYIEFKGKRSCRMVCKRKCGHKGRHEAEFVDGKEFTPSGIWWNQKDCGFLANGNFGHPELNYEALNKVFRGGGESYDYGDGVKAKEMYRHREGAVVEQLYESFCEEIGVRCPRRSRKLNKRPG